ncbi:hypothetical protein ACFFX0_19025 [Citricoccus parietis]|uniref:Transposase n=1 Tax=Citricoccus parietis TaxID=592307 RepID=A0ABV5G2M4_9MICC
MFSGRRQLRFNGPKKKGADESKCWPALLQALPEKMNEWLRWRRHQMILTCY